MTLDAQNPTSTYCQSDRVISFSGVQFTSRIAEGVLDLMPSKIAKSESSHEIAEWLVVLFCVSLAACGAIAMRSHILAVADGTIGIGMCWTGASLWSRQNEQDSTSRLRIRRLMTGGGVILIILGTLFAISAAFSVETS
jgi:F420-0:gamma-glutamyl ligase